METFTYFNPTKIEFGTGKEYTIGQHLAQHGIRKVLLCYGSQRIKQDGLFDVISRSLADHAITLVELGGIVSNPVLSTVRAGIDLARAQNIEAVLSVGGGSVLDSAKAIAAGTLHDGDVWDLFLGEVAIDAALPVFAVQTLAATGSEMNSIAVITNEDTREKFWIESVHIYPRVSIVNPALMRTVSRDYLVFSAADIIAHSIEGYFTASQQPRFLSRLAESIINTVIDTTETLLVNPENYAARSEFAWASTQALNGLIYAGSAGVSHPNHMIEHALSALFNVPHGAGLSVVIPAWMKWYHTRNRAQFDRFAKHVFGAESAEQGIVALERWFDKIGTPTRLSQVGVGAGDLPATIEIVLANAKRFGIAEVYTREVVAQILESAL